MANQKVLKVINVKAGKNTCDICSETTHFAIRDNTHHKTAQPTFELLSCGHGICSSCYDEICKRTDRFACPYCRSSGLRLIKMGGASETCINTFSEFVEHWQHKEHLLSMYQGAFMNLYREICKNAREETKKRAQEAEMAKIVKKKQEKREARKLSREKAVCKYCNKDTFTSMKQLQLHISKKHDV
ncbi:MAG: hypothetical protein CL512_06515 [Actinobacteria bacterium]|nr:hypothetical protein [Actinomycetota bacterium]